MATQVVSNTDKSGTSNTIDVTLLELDADLLLADYIVTHDGVNTTASYTKTSQTQLSYSGSSVVLGTVIIARRVTDLDESEVIFLTTTTATELTNAMVKLRNLSEEAAAYQDYIVDLLNQAGVSIEPLIEDTAFGVSWNGVTGKGASKNAIYDKIVAMDSATATNSTNITTNTNNISTLNTSVSSLQTDKLNANNGNFSGTLVAANGATLDADNTGNVVRVPTLLQTDTPIDTRAASIAYVRAAKRLVAFESSRRTEVLYMPNESSQLDYITLLLAVETGDQLLLTGDAWVNSDGTPGIFRADMFIRKVSGTATLTLSGFEKLANVSGEIVPLSVHDRGIVTGSGTLGVALSFNTIDNPTKTQVFDAVFSVLQFR